MKRINNKGFTLVEIIAVIAIIAVVGLIAVPNVLTAINSSTQATYDILVKDITVAGIQLFEEVEFDRNIEIFRYTVIDGKLEEKIKPEKGNETTFIKINLQTLVSNGFLTGTNNLDNINKNDKIITNPKTKKDIGECEIKIIKEVDSNFNTSYIIEQIPSDDICPTTEEYNKALNK